MKKLLALLLALAMIFSLAACGGSDKKDATADGNKDTAASDIKVGFICLHDEKSTYDLNFLNGVDEVKKALGLKDSQVIVKTNVPEGDECYQAAAALAAQRCALIFANSFGHEDFMIKAAKEFTDVQFCHATGTKAHTEKLANYHNAFASI